VDVVGLVTRQVAQAQPVADEPAASPNVPVLPGHQRHNAAFVLSTRPDLIMVRSYVPAYREFVESDGFRARYTWDPALEAFRRREYQPHR
jgi:hypothetical protein